MSRRAIPVLLALTLAAPLAARAQPHGNPAALIAAQREAMIKLAFLDGVWRGPAWTILPSGEKHAVTQTERVGSLLGGSVKVIEGRGYEADRTVGFNAFAVVVKDGVWRETGDRLMPGKDPVRFFEMELERVGDTGWPGEGAPGAE